MYTHAHAHAQVPAVLGAMTALSMLLGTGTLSWDDCLNYTPAWDTLLWFSILVSMCNALSASGLVAQFAQVGRTTRGHTTCGLQRCWIAQFAQKGAPECSGSPLLCGTSWMCRSFPCSRRS
eukprot:scaffold8801_cov21-Tisochrysis_lutea.AAC.1